LRGSREIAEENAVIRKPTVADLGIDLNAQAWQRSGRGDQGTGEGAIEIAFVAEPATGRTEWVLMRVGGDPAGRVLVYDRREWECFLAGVRDGEFDEAAT
jgi:hypothetical protein